MAGQNTFQILLLDDANMIGEYQETRMLYGCPFEKIHISMRIDANSGFGRDRDTIWKTFNNCTFIALQIKVFDPKII